MKNIRTVLPVFLALIFVFGIAYYFFSIYKPKLISQVKGTQSTNEKSIYLDTLALPSGSFELGRNVRDKFSQITVSSSKSATEIQRFYRSLLVSKGWKTSDLKEDLLSVIYMRDKEKLEVSVLSADNSSGQTIFSLLLSTH